MLSLSKIDAAFRRLKEYDPDFDVSLLSVDDVHMTPQEIKQHASQARLIRITLLARIADIGTRK